ncbi:THAP domain-containing protein 5 isoform X1 [Pantherophis guttatus]|uniref:THAP domain-containing protein 5 n=2 Tax=Pantherophis guttatus TaxID=94885 RepID=A0A6P9D7V0_PANGU|nr:THAP domain-containing protein 5 isoform X1 [Pantherophis guttatus]
MPRYCAATCCRNRAGQSARDQRKLSFYPFPLHDKERLEKWLRNMKRDTWTPSKHQVLCSDHFTSDSLDVRWGIRYLKTTAVPTIFSSSENQEKGISQKKTQVERIEGIKEMSTCITTSSLKSCSPKRNILPEGGLYRKTFETNPDCSAKAEGLTQNIVKDGTAYSGNCVKQNKQQANQIITTSDTENTGAIHSNIPGNSRAIKNIFNAAATDLQVSVRDLQSCFEHGSDSKATILQATHPEHGDSSLEFTKVPIPMSELKSDQFDSHIANCSIEVQTDESSVLLQSMSQVLEQLSGNKESVITIIVPSEDSRIPLLLEGSFISAEEVLTHLEAENSVVISSCSSLEMLQTEHSYCRQDTDREQLWQKITKLHSKIALLEVQERKTLSRLKAIETLIAKLKQDNLLSEEKLKIVENCFTTFEVTMIQ